MVLRQPGTLLAPGAVWAFCVFAVADGIIEGTTGFAVRVVVLMSAIAFAAWMAVTEVLEPSEHRFFVSSIMLGVAVLVAHTRIETGIHSTLEVVYGGLLGAGVTLVVFQLFL